MGYLIEILLFLVPFAAFWLWRRYWPGAEPSTVLLVATALAVLVGIGGAVWYGLSRSADRGMAYVAPRWSGEREDIEPGRAEPGRAAAPPRRPAPAQAPLTRRSDPAAPAPDPRP
ncbi:hypothetical protein [Caldovatus aquaticus]|uniref:Uncharacterized protein n=1 Tax=Caldovatus aquaticus TaxID=2865671 RepID=A0ABS7F622_9PROT|nr:hypothetical protein [Caldovatus aquaticus]MBW8271068.1 hypothetical protein [Caldovatus aquaticus]